MFFALPLPAPVHPGAPIPSHHATERIEPVSSRRRDPLDGLSIHIKLDGGAVVMHIDRVGECAYIDAAWPYSRTSMRLVIERARFYGYSPIPEDESPAEILPNGMTRVWLMETNAYSA